MPREEKLNGTRRKEPETEEGGVEKRKFVLIGKPGDFCRGLPLTGELPGRVKHKKKDKKS